MGGRIVKVTLSVFAEDGDYAYRNILDDDTMGGFPFGEVLEAITPCLTRNFVDKSRICD